MKQHFFDIAIVRAILVFCIVIGHGFVFYLNGLTWPLPEGVLPSYNLQYINPVFISFQLQAFVMISGYLFASQQECKRQSIYNFILKKTKRILLPCLLFGVLYYFLILWNGESLSPLQMLRTIFNGAGHLWFLPMLFCCYIVGKLMDEILGGFNKLYSWPILILFICVSMGSLVIPGFWCISNAVFYYVFFYLGVLLYKNRELIISRFCHIKYLIVLCVATLIMVWVYAHGVVTDGVNWIIMRALKIVLGIVGSTTLWLTANYFIQRIDIDNHKLIRCLLLWNGWYGVYIIHQFVLKYMYYKTSVSLLLGQWLPWVGILVALILSYIITTLMLKTKFGRYLIG